MSDSFHLALAHVLAHEGGYADHPDDPGGATKFGITRATLERFRGHPVGKDDVKALTREEAARVYRRLYWDACHCARLPAGLALAVFDGAVNQGTARAAAMLQAAAGVPVDGRIGPVTLRAVRRRDPVRLLDEFMARRMWHYGRLQRLFQTFGLGWSRRLMATHRAALALLAARTAASAPRAGAAAMPAPAEPRSIDQAKGDRPMAFILKRLQEPSTYAGIAAFLAGFGLLGLTEAEWNQVFGAVAALAGAVAIFIGEQGRP